MKIVLTGASGGIGRSLMATLGADHEMVGVVRTPRPDVGGLRYVAFADKPALAVALADAEIVIHCALDAKTSGRDFGDMVEILSGLTGSERVISNPPDSLSPGDTVRVVTQADAPAAAAQP